MKESECWKVVKKVLKKYPSGLNFRLLARKAGIAPSSLQYWLYGQNKKGKEYGGQWKNKIEVIKIGNVSILKLKGEKDE